MIIKGYICHGYRRPHTYALFLVVPLLICMANFHTDDYYAENCMDYSWYSFDHISATEGDKTCAIARLERSAVAEHAYIVWPSAIFP